MTEMTRTITKTMPDILFHGSVKTVRGNPNQSPYVFEFTDNYSVFDWGKMPDILENKGEALSYISNLFFDLIGNKNEWLKWDCPDYLKTSSTYQRVLKEGIRHHFIGKIDENMQIVPPHTPSRFLAVKPVNILRPTSVNTDKKLRWIYDQYQTRPVNTLIPLEVIFRFDIPSGSSLLERAKDQVYLNGINLRGTPTEGDTFEKPLIEFSSKLETTDRYMTYPEAQASAGLSNEEFQDLKDLTTLLALRLKSYFNECSIKLLDGKFEFAWDENRHPILVDVITPDELRISYKGKSLSKENLRKFYRTTKWHHDVKVAKEMATSRGEKDWKSLCKNELQSLPPRLASDDLKKFSMIYMALSNSLFEKLTGKTIYPTAWTLDELISKL